MKIWSHDEITRIALLVFAINMQKLRRKQDITFEDLSRNTSMSVNRLKNLESGKVKDINIINLFDISKSLGVKLHKMFSL